MVTEISKAEMINLYSKDLVYDIVIINGDMYAKTVETEGFSRGTIVHSAV